MGELFGPPHYNVKQKLTIGLSKEVIEKAKAARINISAITEQILRAYTYEPSGYTKDDVIEAYGEFFKSIQPVLDKYGADVKVGQRTHFSEGPVVNSQDMEGPFPLLLDDRGKLLIWLDEADPDLIYPISITEALPYLYDPPTILENLMNSLINVAEVNKNKLQTFKFASRFLKMLSEDEEHSSSAKQET